MSNDMGHIFEKLILTLSEHLTSSLKSDLPKILEDHYSSLDESKFHDPYKLLKAEEVADMLSISKPSVHRLNLPKVVLGKNMVRFIRKDIIELIDKNKL